MPISAPVKTLPGTGKIPGLLPAWYRRSIIILTGRCIKTMKPIPVRRTFGNVALNYAVTGWLNIMGRISVDNYDELQEERNAAGSIGVSSYSRVNRSYNETNYDFLATVTKSLSKDFTFNGLAGVNIRKNTISSISAATSGGLIVPGLYYIANSLGTVPAPVKTTQRERWMAILQALRFLPRAPYTGCYHSQRPFFHAA